MNSGEFLNSDEVKVIHTYISLTEHFAYYVKENDRELFKRAVDYAKTFTEQDIEGIEINYLKDENNER